MCPGRDAASMSRTPSCPSPGGWRRRAGPWAGVAPGQRVGRRRRRPRAIWGGRTSTRAPSREEHRRRPAWLREETAASILSGPLGTGSVGLGDASPADPAAIRHSAKGQPAPGVRVGPRDWRRRGDPDAAPTPEAKMEAPGAHWSLTRGWTGRSRRGVLGAGAVTTLHHGLPGEGPTGSAVPAGSGPPATAPLLFPVHPDVRAHATPDSVPGLRSRPSGG